MTAVGGISGYRTYPVRMSETGAASTWHGLHRLEASRPALSINVTTPRCRTTPTNRQGSGTDPTPVADVSGDQQ